MITPIS